MKGEIKEYSNDLEIVFIDGDSFAFKAFIDSQGDSAVVGVVDEKYRWVITREDGSQYIARPTNIQ